MFLLKIYYRNAQTENLLWMLHPTSILTSLMTGIKFIFVSSKGYVSSPMGIIIDKSCAGINFFILCFTIAVFSKSKTCKSFKELSINYIILLGLSYFITITANAFRITGALLIVKLINNTNFVYMYNWLHHAEGTIVYLTILIIFYFLLEKKQIIYIDKISSIKRKKLWKKKSNFNRNLSSKMVNFHRSNSPNYIDLAFL